LTAVFAAAIGCATPKGPNLRTPMPEQFNVPPGDDSRFSQPISYPKDVLNQEPVKPTSPNKLPGQGPGGGMASPGGMGRGVTPGGF
jgi:hypothetical protein